MKTNYTNINLIYTDQQLVSMGRIRLSNGKDPAREGWFINELPEMVGFVDISNFNYDPFKGEQDVKINCIRPIYKLVQVTLPNKKQKAFYIISDLVDGKINKYGIPLDNTIYEMLKKYKYIEE